MLQFATILITGLITITALNGLLILTDDFTAGSDAIDKNDSRIETSASSEKKQSGENYIAENTSQNNNILGNNYSLADNASLNAITLSSYGSRSSVLSNHFARLATANKINGIRAPTFIS